MKYGNAFDDVLIFLSTPYNVTSINVRSLLHASNNNDNDKIGKVDHNIPSTIIFLGQYLKFWKEWSLSQSVALVASHPHIRSFK